MYNEFGGTLSNLALAKHRKAVQSMQKIQEEKKEREVWQPVILDHPEREARVLMTSQVVRQ